MKRMGRLEIALVSVLGVALLASAGVILFQSRRLAELARQQQASLQSLRETREALRQSERRAAAATAKAPESANENRAAHAQRDAAIQRLHSEISQARTSVTALQEQLSIARNESQQALAHADARSQELQSKWQNRLDALQLQLSSAQAGLQNARQRITALEGANASLRNEKSASSTQAAEQEKVLASLQDLDRRREVCLTSIADRYRDLTNRFRTMSGMLDANRNGNSGAFSGAALDLIQNAITLTDTDLQHLSELNAKAFQLEKKLRKK
jgi:chromosome segregation ATPase